MAETLDRGHKSLERSKDLSFTERLSKIATVADLAQIKTAFLNYPENLRPAVKNVVTCRSVVITPEKPKQERDSRTGFIFLQGFGGTSAGAAHLGGDLFNQWEKEFKTAPQMVATVSSLSSADNVDLNFPENHLERVASIALEIVKMAEDYNLSNLQIAGHSLGAMEAVYLTKLVQSLLEQRKKANQPQAKIDGVLLINPAGLIKQGRLSFIGKSAGIGSFIPEIVHLFPSMQDLTEAEIRRAKLQEKGYSANALSEQIAEMKGKQFPDNLFKTVDDLKNARQKGDLKLADQIEQQIQQMLAKLHQQIPSLDYLTNEQSRQLLELDWRIEKAKYGEEEKIPVLIKQRDKLLSPVLQSIGVGPDIRKGAGPHRNTFFQVAKANFINTAGGMIDFLPRGIRETVDTPVAILATPADVLFPQQGIKSAIVDQKIADVQKIREEEPDIETEELYQQGATFPNAPALLFAGAESFPHISDVIVPKRLAEIAVDIFRRMKEIGVRGPGQPQQVIELNY